MAKIKRFKLTLSVDMFESGDQLSSGEINMRVIRRQYSRWWERLLNWLSGDRWFSTNPDHIVYITEIID